MASLEQVSEYSFGQFRFHFLESFLGKTLLAKAVANQTSATFLRVVGSELIQKYLVNSISFLNKRTNFVFRVTDRN